MSRARSSRRSGPWADVAPVGAGDLVTVAALVVLVDLGIVMVVPGALNFGPSLQEPAMRGVAMAWNTWLLGVVGAVVAWVAVEVGGDCPGRGPPRAVGVEQGRSEPRSRMWAR